MATGLEKSTNSRLHRWNIFYITTLHGHLAVAGVPRVAYGLRLTPWQDLPLLLRLAILNGSIILASGILTRSATAPSTLVISPEFLQHQLNFRSGVQLVGFDSCT
ncbi:hypothetical protein L208DRAFT_1393895 [Tricholoma matsutake]|nr:hypothetical protein L208DRAFT_1393895 [Tricholoma matsutake 945]